MDETLIVGNDAHFPLQRRESIRQFLELVKDRKPTAVCLNGDILNATDFSRFTHLPSKAGIMGEMRQARVFLKAVREAAPEAEIKFIYGNHSLHVVKRLLERLPEAWGLVDLDDLLGLPDLGITSVCNVERDNYWRWKDVIIGHFSVARIDSGQSVMKLLKDTGLNVIQAHCHRLALVYRTDLAKTLWGMESGALCKLRPPYGGAAVNWQSGAAIVVNDGRRSEPELCWFR